MSPAELLATLPDVRETSALRRAVDAGDVVIDLDDEFHGVQLPPHTRSAYERWAKPVVDRGGAAVLLVLLLPVLLVVALAVRVQLGPGVFFRQERVGRDGHVFRIHKFRTMRHDRRAQRMAWVGQDRRQHHKTPDDPRHTDLGRWLRTTSLDELPQLWDVLRGRMSLVGPRPELPEIVARYAPWEHRRHDVKPGLTGLWQVTERDENGLMHLHVATDLVYVRSISFWTDLRMLALTVPAVFGNTVPRVSGAPAHH